MTLLWLSEKGVKWALIRECGETLMKIISNAENTVYKKCVIPVILYGSEV